MDFVNAADFHARRDGAGLLPALRNESVNFIIWFTVTDEIQIHGFPFCRYNSAGFASRLNDALQKGN